MSCSPTKSQPVRYRLTVGVILALLLSSIYFYSDDNHSIMLVLQISMAVIMLFYVWTMRREESDLINARSEALNFLANMSHEMRTPLNSMIGFSEQLGQSRLTNRQTRQVNIINDSCLMLLTLVNDILELSKSKSKLMVLAKTPFIPNEIIQAVVDSLTIQAGQKGIELHSNISPKNNTCVSGDSHRLKQVLINLLSNAIKFTSEGSVSLTADLVTISSTQALLKIEISDTGIGIKFADLKMIFNEFAQVNPLDLKGTGLGLSITKKIIELQHGLISVSSEPGKGSTFSFEIPFALCTEKMAASVIRKDTSFAKLIGKHILIADDNEMNILLLQTVLVKYKMIADIAMDGKAALELFASNHYDLILTDIKMPKMGGIELTRAVRAHLDLQKRHTPILGVTANVLMEDKRLYVDSGMDDLVCKPFSEREVIDKMLAQFKN